MFILKTIILKQTKISLRIKEYYQNVVPNSRLPKPPLRVSVKGGE